MERVQREIPLEQERVWEAEGLPVLRLELRLPQPPEACDDRVRRRIARYYQLQARACLHRCTHWLLPQAQAACAASLADGQPPLCFQVSLEHCITRNSDSLWSLFTQTRELTGAGPALLLRWGDTWDLRTGYLLSLPQFFPRKTPWKRLLLEHASSVMEAQERDGTACWRPDWRKQLRRRFDPRSFYLTEEGLCVFYGLFALGPAAEGIPVFSLPYAPEGPLCLPR